MAGSVCGVVKWYNEDKGYGFITPESGGKDVFVHRTAVEKSGLDGLDEGEKVMFDQEAGQKGPKALNISRISS